MEEEIEEESIASDSSSPWIGNYHLPSTGKNLVIIKVFDFWKFETYY